MKRLYFTIALCIVMLALLPFPQYMACGTTAPLYTHFIYMFGHATFLHWLINSWSLLVLHNLFRPSRLIVAYALAVVISFLMPASPVIGISVIVCFFIGFIANHIYHRSRLSFFLTLAILLLSCVLPGFAGCYHIIMFVMGALYFLLEGFLIRLKNYCSHD